jgi:tetratricopeptide (TPR) repeat protein
MMIGDPQALLRRSIQAHRDGDLTAAEAGYRDVLAADPEQVDATHYLGMIAYQKGDLRAALEMVVTAARARPEDAAILANLGMVLLDAGQTRRAAEALDRSLAIRPDQTDALLNLARARQLQDRREDAVGCYRRVLELSPGHRAARLTLAQLYLDGKQADEALTTLDAGLKLDPSDAELRLGCGQAHDLAGDIDEALACYLQVADESPERRSRAMTLASTALRKIGRPAAALMAARSAAWADAGSHWAWRALGQALKELGWLDEAAAAFRRAHGLARDPEATPQPGLPTFSRTSRAKLRHDLDQYRYLAEVGIAGESIDEAAAVTERVMENMPHDLPDGQTVSMPPPALQQLAPFYNRCLHYRDTPRLGGSAVSPDLDAASVTADFRGRPPGLTWIDGFLVPEALDALRRFCLESTIWYDFEHSSGYVGAYLQEGFNCPLLVQIAEELPRRLPEIFGDHVLMQMWAYKYDSDLEGIDMHADFAAINVNFWITPTEANLDSRSGGMVIWDKEAPADWGVDEYNTYDPRQQKRILDYLESSGAERLVVPHRQNRCVIFDSDLFHKTDDICFGHRYEDRRINVTMLYGTRDDDARGRRAGSR